MCWAFDWEAGLLPLPFPLPPSSPSPPSPSPAGAPASGPILLGPSSQIPADSESWGPTGRAVVGGGPPSAHQEGQRRQQGELPKPPEEPRSPYLEEEAQHEGQRPEAEAGAYLLGVDTLVGV